MNLHPEVISLVISIKPSSTVTKQIVINYKLESSVLLLFKIATTVVRLQCILGFRQGHIKTGLNQFLAVECSPVVHVFLDLVLHSFWTPHQTCSRLCPQIILLCQSHQFKMAVNGEHLLEYRHRVQDLSSITQLEVLGDLDLQDIKLWWLSDQ